MTDTHEQRRIMMDAAQTVGEAIILGAGFIALALAYVSDPEGKVIQANFGISAGWARGILGGGAAMMVSVAFDQWRKRAVARRRGSDVP